jgi:hypothetical protein
LLFIQFHFSNPSSLNKNHTEEGDRMGGRGEYEIGKLPKRVTYLNGSLLPMSLSIIYKLQYFSFSFDV